MDKNILQRYVEGLTSKEEVEALINWLDEDETHVRELIALHKLHDISLFNNPAAGNENAVQRKHVRDKKYPRKKLRKITVELLKIAAAFLLFMAVSQLIMNKPKEGITNDPAAYQTLFIPAGQRAELLLPDSTKVWLNAKTKLVYPTDFGKGKRIVQLDGEAYFDVKRKEKKPFIVRTEKMDIEVLGTEFNVNAYSGHSSLHVALLEGAIDLKAPGICRNYGIKVNEQARLEDGRLNVAKISNYDYFKWKDGLLCFDDETVATIIEKLQLYFDVKINVNKTELLAYRYTGKFRTKDGVEQVLKVLQLEHRFTYIRDNEHNVITIQ